MRASEIAERALLGALLLEPERRFDVEAWLEKADFWSFRHALVYETIQTLAGERERPTARAVLDRILPDADARRNVDGPYLHTLMESCPHPSRAAIYGRMVLEASIHRQIWDKAKRLEYVVTSDSAADIVIEQVGVDLASQLADVDALSKRWAAAGGEAAVEGEYASQPVTDPNGPPIADDQAEIAIVAALLSSPLQYDQVKDWLEPSDFLRDDMRVAYAAIRSVADRGEPIDPVTVMWSVLRQGGAALAHDALLRLAESGLPGYATVAGRQVLHASIRRNIGRCSSALGYGATSPGFGPLEVLALARSNLSVAALEAQRQWFAS